MLQNSGNIGVDNINIFHIMNFVKRNARFLMFCIGLSVAIALVYILVSPVRYTVSASVITISNGSNLFSGSSINKFLSVPSLKDPLGDKITIILRSKTLKTLVEKDLINYFSKESLVYVKNELDLENNFSFKEDVVGGVYYLKYIYQDKKIAVDVVRSIITNVQNIAEKLEISSSKKLLVVLDEPQTPNWPTHPRKKLSLAISLVMGLFSGLGWIFLKWFIAKSKI